MELKLKTPNKKTIKIQDMEIKVKPYLTTEEIETILENTLSEQNTLIRQMIKDILLIEFCTDINTLKDETGVVINEEVYDLYRLTGLLKKVKDLVSKDDLDLIDKCIEEEESVNKTIQSFCTDAIKSIEEKGKDVDLEKIINTLKEMKVNE